MKNHKDESEAGSDRVSVFNFQELVNIDKWQSVEEYFKGSDEIIAKDVAECVGLRKKLREELFSNPSIRNKVKKPSVQALSEACELLFSGKVCAIDGTVSIIPSQSGGRARIGIAAVSYSGNGIKRVLYISYNQLSGPYASAIEYFTKLKQTNRGSALLMRTVMAFAERELALQQPQDWKFVHGELLPYELWTSLGKGRPVIERLKLAQRLIEAKNIIAVVEGSQNIDILNAGEILDKGEFMEARELKVELEEYLQGSRDDARGAHFNPKDRLDFEDFVSRYGSIIRVGIFKAGPKPYIFQAHRDVFETAAALVLKDAAYQPMRGFPLLIDYADRICAYNLRSSDFDRQIQFKTARLGWEALATEINPRATRRA